MKQLCHSVHVKCGLPSHHTVAVWHTNSIVKDDGVIIFSLQRHSSFVKSTLTNSLFMSK